MSRVVWRGVTLDADTAEMIAEAERLAGFKFELTQGCYSGGSVAASAGTHNGGGAYDVRARDLTARQIEAAVAALRDVGGPAWHRLPSEGDWPEHIHGLRADCPDLAPAAVRQVLAYRAGRSGLASNGPDRHPAHDRLMTWARYKDEHMPLSDDDVKRIAVAVWNWDGIPYTDADGKAVAKGNPNWRPLSVLANAELLGRQMASALAKLSKRVDELAARK